MADLILTFFDPIGQALCKRTLNLVEKLNSAHAEKMRFYLSKADDAGNESDRQRYNKNSITFNSLYSAYFIIHISCTS